MKYNDLAKRFIAAGCATAMVAAFGVAPLAQAQPSATTNVTAAACRAAGMAPEILGIDGIEESGQFISSNTIQSQADLTTANLTDPDYPKYLLMGSDYNSNANRFMYDIESNDPSILYNGSRSGSGNGPNQALSGNDTTDFAVLNQSPDIVVGTGISSKDDTAEDAVYSAYGAKGVTYSFSSNAELCQVMYDLADKADTIVANSNGTKTLRYGTASDIALAYEKFVKGTKGLVLQAIDNEVVAQRTIALVTAYDSTTGKYTIKKTGTSDGTANENRYLEACANVTENMADTLLAEAGDTTSATYEVTKSQLEDADLILVGGQNSNLYSLWYRLVNTENFDNVYFVKNAAGGAANNTAGAGYGVVMNSVENAQNTARILGILYPDVVNEAYFLAYYFETFYHIGSSQLTTTLVNALNGRVPRNANTLSTSPISITYAWTAGNFSGYSQSTVAGLIGQGCAYIEGLIADLEDIPEELEPAAGDVFGLPDTSTN